MNKNNDIKNNKNNVIIIIVITSFKNVEWLNSQLETLKMSYLNHFML